MDFITNVLVEIIATFVAAVIGAIFVYANRATIKRYIDARRTSRLIKSQLREWKESEFSLEKLINHNDFTALNGRGNEIRPESEDELSFLMLSSLKHGFDGKWGYWLCRNTNNSSLAYFLLIASNGKFERLRWRAYYLLEQIFSNRINDFISSLPKELANTEHLNSLTAITAATSVEAYLQDICNNHADTRFRGMAKEVLHEIKEFSQDISKFKKEKLRQSVERLTRSLT